MDPRQYCATCQHIRHVAEAQGTHYECGRLGWPTEPRWRFACWTPRPPKTAMPQIRRPPDLP